MLDEANRMIDSGYTDVRTNQALVDTQGNKVSNMKPDVQGTNPLTRKRDVVEIQSHSQSDKFMDQKKNKLIDALGDEAGDVSWKK